MLLSRVAAIIAMVGLPFFTSAQSRHGATGGAQRMKLAEPTGSLVAIDTTSGRLTCRIFANESQAALQFQQAAAAGKYDGVFITGITDGIQAEATGNASTTPVETENTRAALERAGVLGMVANKGQMSATRFAILEHGDLEYRGRLVPFAFCDDPTVGKVQEISHDLLVAGNRAATPVVINKVFIAKEGESLPAVTPNGPPVTPVYPPKQESNVPAPKPTGPTAVIDTTMGTMRCRLFNETKVATANFIGLAKGTKPWRSPVTHTMVQGKPFYNGLHFDRVIPDFMIEQGELPGGYGGDGGIGIQFSNEIIPGLNFDKAGRLAYANSGPGTNSSEFFITETPQEPLDGSYTIFGQCDADSLKVAALIARVPRDANNRPIKPVTVRRITIQ